MRFVLGFLLLLPTLAYGYGVKVNVSSGSPVPITYAADNGQSQVLTCGNSNKIKVFNECASYIAYSFRDPGSAPASDFDFCPAGPGTVCQASIKGGIGNNTAVYIRSDTGTAITETCNIRVSCVNEETP